jgi:hypothetical protein
MSSNEFEGRKQFLPYNGQRGLLLPGNVPEFGVDWFVLVISRLICDFTVSGKARGQLIF